jgi:erythronate-4-phosphate dehydrogenase
MPGARGPHLVVDAGIPFEGLLREDFYRVTWTEGPGWTRSALAHTDAICVRSTTRVDASLLEGTPVRMVATATSGTDHLDLDWLADRGIAVYAAPGSNAVAVAEYVWANLRALLPDLLTARPRIGIVGCGQVGQCVARRAALLGLDVRISDPPRALAEADFFDQPLDEVLNSDVVTLHVPLTRSGPFPTVNLLDAQRIAALAPGTVVINAARGGVLDEQALAAAVSDHGLRAILDCWDGEPQINPQLLKRAEVATPHCAGHTLDAKQRGARFVTEALEAFFRPGLAPLAATPDGPADGRLALPADPQSKAPLRHPADPPGRASTAAEETHPPLDAEGYLGLLAEQVDFEAVTLELKALAGAEPATRAAGFATIRRRAGLRQELGLAFRDQYRVGTPVADLHLPQGPVRIV